MKEMLDTYDQVLDALGRISQQLCANDPDYSPADSLKPPELWGLRDDDPHITYVDLILVVQRNDNPWPAIMHGLTELRDYEDVLVLRHILNPVWLREKFATCGFASWAEERGIGEWYIYFYRPTVSTGAFARPPLAAVLGSSPVLAARG